jgi:hypothetical protein
MEGVVDAFPDPPQRTLGWFSAASRADPACLVVTIHLNHPIPGRMYCCSQSKKRVHGATVFM